MMTAMGTSLRTDNQTPLELDEWVSELLAEMTVEEKVGQLSQRNGGSAELRDQVRAGQVGSILNEVHVEEINELQRIAREESRLGIPLLVGRDVIHGFKTIFPIPLAQAASWNPEVVRRGASIAAAEAATSGVNWTFAPMVDISRDPRWGRIAESLGEDPHLCSILGAAMVDGFQGEHLDEPQSILACAKHFAGYGAVEGGMDYNTANIPENELRNVYLKPFKACKDSGVATFMASFSDLNGVPASGNEFLMRQILRDEWQFDGFVVSDWDSIKELTVHGFTADDKDAVMEAINAGVNMEMASSLYAQHLPELMQRGVFSEQYLDSLVAPILKMKMRLGLFADPYTHRHLLPLPLNADHLAEAKRAALESCVLLENRNQTLPLSAEELDSIAIIGPLADDGYEQLGTWVFDGDSHHSRTPLQALHELVGDQVQIHWAQGLRNSRCRQEDQFEHAVSAAQKSDVALMFVGEESILSGEAHCRADISLPGSQERLIEAVHATGTPIVLIVMAGRPLTLGNVADRVEALLYAWHPGTMGGPAIADLLFGLASPSGKLPVSFPRVVGQIPIYYARKNTGRPASLGNITHIDDIDGRAPQTSLGMSAFHLDVGFLPQYHFGFGLSYTRFEYSDIQVSRSQMAPGDSIEISATLENLGSREGEEIAQLYLRDLVGSVTRPVRELKGFQRVKLAPGESRRISFRLQSDDLAFYDRHMKLVTEPGDFHAWIGGSCEADLQCEFTLVDTS